MSATVLRVRNNRRVGLLKSRNGCLTCKKRRVKCGEEWPHCHRCTSTGRKCEFDVVKGHDYRSWSRESSSKAHSPSLLAIDSYAVGSLDCSLELRAFEYLFMRGMPIFSVAMDNRFWKTCILQACHTEPVIWDAVLALSALFEHPQYADEPVRGLKGAPRVYPKNPIRDRSHRQALIWYNRSLSKLRMSIENNTAHRPVVLISCIIYICIELLQDNIIEALQLYHRATSIISNSNGSALEKFIASLVHNFSAFAMTMDYISPSMASIPDSEAPTQFMNLEEAESALYRSLPMLVSYRQALGKAIVTGVHCNEHLVSEFDAQKNSVLADLDQWLRNFQALGVTLKGDSSDAEKSTVAKLMQAHATIRSGIVNSLSFSELSNDNMIDIFEEILHYGRYSIAATQYPDGTQPPFLLESSIALPLYICATKCRDYRIRHEALDLLWQAPKVQGLCKATHYALMASQIISIEESGLQLIDRMDRNGPDLFIPESHRIIDAVIISVKNKNGEDGWALKYMRRVSDANGDRIVEELSPFEFSENRPRLETLSFDPTKKYNSLNAPIVK